MNAPRPVDSRCGRALLCATRAALLLLLLPMSLLHADPADVNWSDDFGAPGIEGNIYTLAHWNGSVVVGGWLHYASGRLADNVVRWNGTEFEPMGEGFNDQVTSLAVVGGTLYAAGGFTASGATPLPHVARWTGSAWVAVGTGAPDNAEELELAVDGSSLLLLGAFTEIGSPPVAAQAIARWDGSNWNSMNYAGGTRLRAAARIGSLLYVAGDQLDSFDGTDWAYDLGLGIGASSLAVLGSDLYLSGDFYGMDPLELEMNGVARFDGSTLYSLGGVVPDGQIDQISVDSGQILIVGGFVNTPGPGLAYWDGTNWTPGPWGPFASWPQDALRVGADLFVSGSIPMYYDAVDGAVEGVANILAWDSTRWRALGPGSGVTDNEYVNGLTTWNDRLIASGSFKRIGNIGNAQGIAAWNGTAWSRLGAGLDEAFGNPSGRYMTTWNNRLVVTGYFSGAGGGAVVSENIAAWTGTTWEGFNGGLAAQNAQVVDFGGTLIASSSAGSLGTPPGGGPALGHVARWTGTQWQTIGTVTPIYSLADHGLTVWNGSLVYGGSFSAVDGVPASNVARWDGTSWSALGAGFNNFVTSLAVHNGDLYAAGYFTASGATPIPGRVARWNGSAWEPVGLGLDNAAVDLVSADGKLFATGGISSADGAPALGVAAWDGTNWSGLGSGLGHGFQGNFGGGRCLGVYHDGLFAGGFFNTAGDKSSRKLARWQLGSVTGVEAPPVDARLGLAPPLQNPASGRVNLSFRIAQDGDVQAAVFDVRGRRIQTLLAARLPAGDYPLAWDGRDDSGQAVNAGVYWVRLTTADGRSSRKITWLR